MQSFLSLAQRTISHLSIFSLLLVIGALVACGQVPSAKVPPSSARITLSKAVYAPSDKVVITVRDADENRRPDRIETIEVSLSVPNRTAVQRVKLTETGPNTGIFRNIAELKLSKPKSGTKESVFQAERGDVIKVTYVDPDDPTDKHNRQARVAGGRFSYKIDPTLIPTTRFVSGDRERPVGAVINPDGIRDEFVMNEIIVRTDDPAVLDDILKKYDGKILYGDISANAPGVPFRGDLRPPPDLWGYKLVRVNPARADLRYIASKLTERNLIGNFVFSSEDVLGLGAIIVAEKALGRDVTLNPIDIADACPCDETSEYTNAATGSVDNAFEYQWFDTLGASPDGLDHEYLGVTRVWRLLNGMGIPHDLPNDWLPDYEWRPVRLGIIDTGFEPNDDWPGGVRPDWCYSFNGGFFLATPIGITMDCEGMNEINCLSGPCPWHGTLVYGAAAALANNSFGAAGTAGSCNEPIVEMMLSEREETNFSAAANIAAMIVGGADIINMSFGGNCGGWCRDHAFRSGRNMLSFAIDDATRRGILIVASAGNSGLDLDDENQVQLSCEYGNVLCVSSISWHCTDPATDCFEHRNHNYGSNIDIWAPDDFNVWAPDDRNTTPPYTPAIERTPGGTSIATPYVSGVLALMKAFYPPETRHTFNLAAARSLLRSNAHIGVSTSDRVNTYGGMINPWGMAVSMLEDGHLDAHLVDFDIADIDENEPPEPSESIAIDVQTASVTSTDSVEGIVMDEEDTDIYTFTLDEHYDVLLRLVDESHPGEILLNGSFNGAGSTMINEPMGPGRHSVRVEQDTTAERHPINCYTLEFGAQLTVFDADVFDDEDPQTPPSGPSHAWRNDLSSQPTPLEISLDMWGNAQRLGFQNLNFDIQEDKDFFRVRLPYRSDTDCRRCRCGNDNYCSESLEIRVNTDYGLAIKFFYPDGTDGISPYQAGWETDESVVTSRVIEIDCPYDKIHRGESIVSDSQEILFSIEPQSGNPVRTEYDLEVEFKALDEDDCSDSPFPGPGPSRMHGSPLPDEPTPYYFPRVAASWDCEDLPWCDPAEEYISLDWLGGDFTMEMKYFTLVRSGTPTFDLVDLEGNVVASAIPTARKTAMPGYFVPRNYETHGRMSLGVKSLPKGQYLMKLDGPLPTYFLYREVKKK